MRTLTYNRYVYIHAHMGSYTSACQHPCSYTSLLIGKQILQILPDALKKHKFGQPISSWMFEIVQSDWTLFTPWGNMLQMC